MSFNEKELRKIKQATAGRSKQSARNVIARAISELRPKIENAKKLSKQQRQSTLKRLINEATAARHKALESGANSYGHSEWAAAAACESWLHELFSGTPESIARVETLIDKLEKSSSNLVDKKHSLEKIQIEFFDFSEQTFEISHEIVALREDVGELSGTFLSAIKNLFRKIDYKVYYKRAKIINDKVENLEIRIDTSLNPTNQLEKTLLTKLSAHVQDVKSLSNILMEKFQFLAAKSKSASTPNTSWNNWQTIVEKEDKLLDKCQNSGDNLAEVFYQLKKT